MARIAPTKLGRDRLTGLASWMVRDGGGCPACRRPGPMPIKDGAGNARPAPALSPRLPFMGTIINPKARAGGLFCQADRSRSEARCPADTAWSPLSKSRKRGQS